MCGISGIFDLEGHQIPDQRTLTDMIVPQLHRGPDGVGFFRAPGIGLAHARLSIIDLEGGWQPLANEDEFIWICFNGEIYNYVELRASLIKRGHTFRTTTDTEVLVHLYEETGLQDMLTELNGQYSFALWDGRTQTLHLVRDHVGIHPLHYRTQGRWFQFSSEVKGLLETSKSSSDIDAEALDQLFTFWTPLPGRTLFRDIREIPAGHYMTVSRQGMELVKYWDVPLYDRPRESNGSFQEYSEELLHLLDDATRLRLRADVPVASYLSGGLDSSAITCLTQIHNSNQLRTFSVAFKDRDFDESPYQELLNSALKTDNSSILVDHKGIADAFEKVIWHTEKPVLRTAPTPLFLLAQLVRKSGYKTVLTGEGSDEFLGGYDIFKEAMLRKFWNKNPASAMRASLFQKLYPYLNNFSSQPVEYLREYFRLPATDWDELFSSHWVRWKTTSRIKRFYSDEFRDRLGGYNPVHEIQETFRDRLVELDTLSRAQYLEISTLLPNYLLSSQGDRMAMAHSIEVRFPFLDKRVIELSCRIPAHFRMLGLNEKAVLKRSMRGRLPDEIIRRYKRPYMAPDISSFLTEDGKFHPVVEEHLSRENIEKWKIFNPAMVDNLKGKCLKGKTIGFGDNMTFVGILSTQIWLNHFMGKPREPQRPYQLQIKCDHVISGGFNGSNRQ